MTFQTITLITMLSISTIASADWIDGVSNGAGNTNGNASTWEASKGQTNMDTKMSADGEGNSVANGLADWVGNNTTTGSNNTNGVSSRLINSINDSKNTVPHIHYVPNATPLTHYVPNYVPTSPTLPQVSALTKPAISK